MFQICSRIKVLLLILLIVAVTPMVFAEEVELKTSTGSLYGTLEVPDSSSPSFIVLFIAGSGPTDRDGNTHGVPGMNNSLKYLSEDLVKKGVSTFRFDKRGTGSHVSLGIKEQDLRFETYINDVKAWVNYLRGRYNSQIVILGHSEGSLIGMVATNQENIAGFISVEGSGRMASDIIIEQLEKNLSPDLMKATRGIVDELKAGRTVTSPPPELNALFRESVQPYLISWFKYDPVKEIAKLDIPVLIIQGTTDIQVAVLDAQLLKNANKKSQLNIIEGMNHILKQVPADSQMQIASYSDSALPVSDKMVDVVFEFIKLLEKRN